MNNQFDYLDGEYATSNDFQRTPCGCTACIVPVGDFDRVSYFYGSGARFAANIATRRYGKPGTNRLNLTAAGAAANAIVIPATNSSPTATYRRSRPLQRADDDHVGHGDSAQRARGYCRCTRSMCA